jgi:hypothetical protein
LPPWESKRAGIRTQKSASLSVQIGINRKSQQNQNFPAISFSAGRSGRACTPENRSYLHIQFCLLSLTVNVQGVSLKYTPIPSSVL